MLLSQMCNRGTGEHGKQGNKNEIDHYRFQSQSFALVEMKEESLEHEHIKMVLENILKQIKDKNGKDLPCKQNK